MHQAAGEDFRLEKMQEFKTGMKRNRPEEFTVGRLCEDCLIRKPKPVYKKWQRFRKAGKEWQNPYMVNNVLRDFKVKTKRAGIRSTGKFTNDTMRKTCAQNRADQLPANVVKFYLGHSSMNTTNKFYSIVNESHMDITRKVMDKLLESGKKRDNLDTGWTMAPKKQQEN